MNILAVDTSSKAASVAVYVDNMLCGDCLYNHGKNHSVYIAPMINEMLEACEITLSDIDYYACGTGPGSFTGVRIGVTMMKTFAMVNDKPCVGVDSLYALALSKEAEGKVVVAVEDARRKRVFACAVKDGEKIIKTTVVPLDELMNMLEAYNKKEVIFVGGGCRIYKDEILSKGYSLDWDCLISGRAIGKAAMAEIEKGNTVDCVGLLPEYLLKSQAEQAKQWK